MTTLPSHSQLADRADALLQACHASRLPGDQAARTPITGGTLGSAGAAGSVDDAVERATVAFHAWRDGERWAGIVRRGMTADLSWDVPARLYEEAYRSLKR